MASIAFVSDSQTKESFRKSIKGGKIPDIVNQLKFTDISEIKEDTQNFFSKFVNNTRLKKRFFWAPGETSSNIGL